MKQAQTAHPTRPGNESVARKPYQKPTVRYERVFESSALTCGKVHTTQGQCHLNPKAS